MTPPMKWLCRLLSNPVVLFLLGLLVLLLVLVLLLPVTTGVLLIPLLVLLLLALIGLLVLSLVLARLIAARCNEAVADPKGKGSVGHRGAPRVTIPSDIYKRPDPMIYSQSWLIAQGAGVTWDNPDIQLLAPPDPETGDPGGPVSSHQLEPKKSYRIFAQVWNRSSDAPAVNLLVRFYYLTFGIGSARNHIGETYVNLPVKGAPGLPVIAGQNWTTPDLPGHYCIQVELVWPDDAEPGNNLGQENVDVKALQSPAIFELPVRNEGPTRRTIVLQADAYAIPPLPECPQPPAQRPVETPRAIDRGGILGLRDRDIPPPQAALIPAAARPDALARHARSAFPIPADLGVEFLPSGRLELAPGEVRVVTVRVTAPDGSQGKRGVNVNAFDGLTLVGGVTLYFHG